MNYFDSNRCGQSFHFFARDSDGHVQAYHSDDQLCDGAEFNFAEMLEGDVETFKLDAVSERTKAA